MDTPPLIDSQNIVSFLSRREPYSEQTAGVELIETHISWVFLTDAYAYKLKKPVRFEFLDFSTPQLRREACEDELRLNRRLAADIYLEVVPITADGNGKLSLDGAGAPVDWVVKMRRLKSDRGLDRLIATGSVPGDNVERLAALLTEFFTRATKVAIEPGEYCAAITRHVQANATDLADFDNRADDGPVERVCAAHLRFLRLRSAMLASRVDQGRVIEGHGDLRPEHVYFEGDQPVVIDCVEFSRDLRTVDVADELSFLAMECERLGNEAVGRQLIESYQRRSGDLIPTALLCFYKSYRACVRAKVTALRGRQLPPAQQAANCELLGDYLTLADQNARRMMPPLLLVIRGLMGSGKSTMAQSLATTLGLTMLSTDEIRRGQHGAPTEPPEYGEGIYDAKQRRRVYDSLFASSQALLKAGTSVVLDGTFLTDELRRIAVNAARSAGALALIVTCRCPADMAKSRIAARQSIGDSLSDARAELLSAQQAEDEPMSADLPHFGLDVTGDVVTQADWIVDRLAAELAAHGGES